MTEQEHDLVRISIIDSRQSKRPALWRSAAVTIIAAAVLFGPGILADSAAMQWAGFVVLLGLVALTAVGYTRERLTIDDARKRLDELERGNHR